MQSISKRISGRLLALSSLVTLVALAVVLGLMALRFHNQLHAKAESSIAFIADVLAPRLWTMDEEGAMTVAEAMAQDAGIGFLEVVDASGKVLYAYGSSKDLAMIEERDITYRDRIIGQVRLGLNDALRRAAMLTVAVVGIGVAALLILLQYFVSGHLLRTFFKRPLADVTALAEAYAGGDYRLRTNSATFSEFLPLMQTLEGMGRTIHKQVHDLRESEERYRAIFNNTPLGIFRTTLDGRFVELNQALASVMGYEDREEALATMDGGSATGFYANPQDREDLLAALREKPGGLTMETLFTDKEGKRRSAYLHASLGYDAEGLPAYIDGVIEDITERKRMQEMMVQSEKMVSVGGIAAGIAHEINNPLGIILQTAQNLEQRIRPDFDKNVQAAEKIGLDMDLLDTYMRTRRIHSFVENIQTAALRAAAIIRHMLDFSRRSESKRMACDLRDVIDKAILLASSDYDLKKNYDFKKITITKDYPASLPRVDCTETEIEQVVLNLLRNAAQAMAQAEPPIDKPELTLRIRQTEGHQRMEVRDNGPGMPPEIRRKVFEPFFTTKPTGEGTGLGLSVSYFIVTQGHCGKMSVESIPGEGTTFIVELPVGTDAKETQCSRE